MTPISPFLWFDTEAEEAAAFYVSLFPNSRIVGVQRLEGAPGPEGKALTVDFELDGRPFVALNGGPQYRFTEAFSLAIRCDTQAEVDRLWDKLTADGGEPGPCGWLKDRWGLSWQVVPKVMFELLADPDRARADRAMQAMLKMGKLDSAALLAAADGEAA